MTSKARSTLFFRFRARKDTNYIFCTNRHPLTRIHTNRMRYDPKVWQPYTQDVQRDIENAWQRQADGVRVRIRGRIFELHFKHYIKNAPTIMGIQHSRNGKRAFHFCLPGTDTHIQSTTAATSTPVTIPVGTTTTVVPSTTTTTTQKKVWCWLASDPYDSVDKWVAYDDKLQGVIDRACMSASMRTRVRIGGRPYIIDVMSRTQVSEHTGGMRKIEKTVPTGSGGGSTGVTNNNTVVATPVVATPVVATPVVATPTVPAATTHTPSSTTTTTLDKKQGVMWQWNAGNKRNRDWKDYDGKLNTQIEKAYQDWIKGGRRNTNRFYRFKINQMSMEIDFDYMMQDTNRGSRSIQRIDRGGGDGKSSSSSSSHSSKAESLAVVVQTDGSLRDAPTNLDRTLHVGAIVEFEIEKTGSLGFGTFRKQVKGKVLGKSERRNTHVVVRCCEDDRKYEVPGSRLKIVPLVPLKDIPSWQSEACKTFSSGSTSIPVECVVESIIQERDPYYGDTITKKKERHVSVDDIEVTCKSLKVGDRIRALWKTSDRKDYPGMCVCVCVCFISLSLSRVCVCLQLCNYCIHTPYNKQVR